MPEIQALEAKVHLPRLLEDVEKGEKLIVTRHVQRIARIVPEMDRQPSEIDNPIGHSRELRQRTGKTAISGLLSARGDGRKR